MNTQAIASHLNIVDSAIIEIQEWASVLWVKFIGGVRFVSKKIGANAMSQELSAEEEYLLECERDGSNEKWNRIEAMEARLSHYVSGYHSESRLRSIACDVIDGEITEAQAIARLTSKKPIKK
jgi:hypothetical protein